MAKGMGTMGTDSKLTDATTGAATADKTEQLDAKDQAFIETLSQHLFRRPTNATSGITTSVYKDLKSKTDAAYGTLKKDAPYIEDIKLYPDITIPKQRERAYDIVQKAYDEIEADYLLQFIEDNLKKPAGFAQAEDQQLDADDAMTASEVMTAYHTEVALKERAISILKQLPAAFDSPNNLRQQALIKAHIALVKFHHNKILEPYYTGSGLTACYPGNVSEQTWQNFQSTVVIKDILPCGNAALEIARKISDKNNLIKLLEEVIDTYCRIKFSSPKQVKEQLSVTLLNLAQEAVQKIQGDKDARERILKMDADVTTYLSERDKSDWNNFMLPFRPQETPEAFVARIHGDGVQNALDKVTSAANSNPAAYKQSLDAAMLAFTAATTQIVAYEGSRTASVTTHTATAAAAARDEKRGHSQPFATATAAFRSPVHTSPSRTAAATPPAAAAAASAVTARPASPPQLH
jgi:hypothetical protein